jgi:hypothetical protein
MKSIYKLKFRELDEKYGFDGDFIGTTLLLLSNEMLCIELFRRDSRYYVVYVGRDYKNGSTMRSFESFRETFDEALEDFKAMYGLYMKNPEKIIKAITIDGKHLHMDLISL